MNPSDSSAGALWTAVVDAVGLPDCEMIEQENAAFIRVFTWASSHDHASARVRKLMADYKIHILSINDVEPFQEGNLYGEEPELLSELLAQTIATKGVIFGTFNLYPFEDGRKQ